MKNDSRQDADLVTAPVTKEQTTKDAAPSGAEGWRHWAG